MPNRGLLAGEHAVLALLTLRPMHGYEMARYFSSDLAEVCPLEQGLLYSYIRNIEARGLIAATEERVGNRPPRKVHALTAEGRAAASEWLRQPVPRIRQARLELLVKLYILQGTPGAESDLVARQLAVFELYRDRGAAMVAERSGFARLVAASRLSAAEATLAWLRDYAANLARPQPGRDEALSNGGVGP
ncbi:MAG: PadR family transcriptional regulator [Dehalococcoidia bacterium]